MNKLPTVQQTPRTLDVAACSEPGVVSTRYTTLQLRENERERECHGSSRCSATRPTPLNIPSFFPFSLGLPQTCFQLYWATRRRPLLLFLRSRQQNNALLRGFFNYFPDMVRNEVQLYKRFAERLEPFIADTVHFSNESISQKKRILVEGSQATMLDIDFGTYPFVTSSSPSASGISTGLGIAPRHIGDIIGVVKSYTTRVGSGPFPTEISGEGGDALRVAGTEFGTTTGRPRRCGWLDAVALKYSCMINGFSSLSLAKLDVLLGLQEIKSGVAYKHIDGRQIDSFPADLQVLDPSQASKHYFNSWVIYELYQDGRLIFLPSGTTMTSHLLLADKWRG
ncbi:Adenylosuccinate synthetase 2, chloroplastic [Asimina triloba]